MRGSELRPYALSAIVAVLLAAGIVFSWYYLVGCGGETITNRLLLSGGIIVMIIGGFSYYILTQMAQCRKPDAPYIWQIANNRLKITFYPDDLTPQGRRYRYRYLVSSTLFTGGWIAWVAIGAICKVH
jgi:hypothetical protein